MSPLRDITSWGTRTRAEHLWASRNMSWSGCIYGGTLREGQRVGQWMEISGYQNFLNSAVRTASYRYFSRIRYGQGLWSQNGILAARWQSTRHRQVCCFSSARCCIPCFPRWYRNKENPYCRGKQPGNRLCGAVLPFFCKGRIVGALWLLPYSGLCTKENKLRVRMSCRRACSRTGFTQCESAWRGPQGIQLVASGLSIHQGRTQHSVCSAGQT